MGGTGPFAYQWQFNGANLPNNIITTVAGNGSATFAGDGNAATNASLYGPWGVAFDTLGNLYIADSFNNRIREVDTNGIIATVAGDGTNGYSGDADSATNAKLNYPNGVAFDASGDLYIADSNNDRIRQVDTNGIIATVAGGGPGGDGGAATSATLAEPYGVTLDAIGNLYISDDDHASVRKVATNGIITTMAGEEFSPGYSGDGGLATDASLFIPRSVALDTAGNMYIADSQNCRIRKVNTSGIISTLAGNGNAGYFGDGGPATEAWLAAPSGVAVDASGNLYIADGGNNRIRKVNANGIITTVAGNGDTTYAGDGGPATNASLIEPASVAFDVSGNLYIGDTGNNRIREVHFAGDPMLVLTNVSATNVGNYTVVITSPYGSVTSAVATLTVNIPLTPPQIISSGASFGFLTNQFGFNLIGAFGQTIVVDGSTDLVDWTPLFTNTVVISPFYFFDSASTNSPWRFYRARLP